MTKRFEEKQEKQIIKALNNVFTKTKTHISEATALKLKGVFLFSPCNVLCLEAKSEEAKRCLSEFIDEKDVTKNELSKSPPTLDYNSKEDAICKFGTEYLKVAIDIFTPIDKSIKLSICKDYPITLEDEHFKIIIAPRIDADD